MAFCTNCGAQVEEGAAFCTSCGAKVGAQNESTSTQNYYQPPKQQASNEGVYGIGGAITSAILGFVGLIFSIVTYIMGMNAFWDGYDMAVVTIMFAMTSLALCIIGLILGVKSIGNFKKGRALGKKPIGTLIVGIGGIALSGYGLLFAALGSAIAFLVIIYS